MSALSTLQDRLLKLPKNVSTPFGQLLEAKHLSEETISGVLDIVQLGGRAEHALAYAVTYQHLVATQVPINDILAMAKQHHRRINPKWSRARWMEEHSKLGRISTLIALAESNCEYVLSEFEKYLPEKFPGYLIRTSKRLGAEGLRQGHCVAMYDKYIRGGHTCMAVVFVNKERWTVQLSIVNRTLQVVQIKAKYNQPASKDIRERINEVLGLETSQEEDEISSAEHDAENLKLNLLTVCNRLRMIGVERVVADFDGYGDSGTVDTPLAYDGSQNEVKIGRDFGDMMVDYTDSVFQWNPEMHQRTYSNETCRLCLEDALSRVIESHIESKGQDWYNNEGGFGEYVLNVTEARYCMSINVRYAESELVVSDVGVSIEEMG